MVIKYKHFKKLVTILILIDGFLQYENRNYCLRTRKSHNPYFNRWFSAITTIKCVWNYIQFVTILILIDGFLQYVLLKKEHTKICSHNPYFNRWFSAMQKRIRDVEGLKSHNPYFNRWFSAIS